jgi:hypothetical protein
MSEDNRDPVRAAEREALVSKLELIQSGGRGSISLVGDAPRRHEMVAQHECHPLDASPRSSKGAAAN